MNPDRRMKKTHTYTYYRVERDPTGGHRVDRGSSKKVLTEYKVDGSEGGRVDQHTEEKGTNRTHGGRDIPGSLVGLRSYRIRIRPYILLPIRARPYKYDRIFGQPGAHTDTGGPYTEIRRIREFVVPM